MPDTYRITVTTKSGETHVGLMNRSQPEIVNDFIGVAKEDGAWIYLAPDDVLKMEYVPEPDVEKQTSKEKAEYGKNMTI
ncbi:hypothetical protein BBB56_07490 [Candidatus Pantoea deserta]|uniref:Uncharacterized protein n=1 Tax=Candidatus Pantoea deserta TaxID=1869313 RepID=A0A3N4P3J5_9GAMM|nr:hypothetical protein [Pantoea deserta]RPE03222.1 hypothetical protein BBB56_07490 [Pantoea deserta]